jgi:hypothetical protein
MSFVLRTLLCLPRTIGARELLTVLAVVAGSFAASPAHAQGFLDFLFGGGAPPKPAVRQPQIVTPGGRPYESRSVFGPSSWPRANTTLGRSSGGGSFRTLCVRTCDGYYFPISSAATRDDFLIDQSRCNAACGSEARLFYVPASRPDIDNAVDMSGRPYSALPKAFLYRKSLVNGCSCRAQPWSEAELARHRRYAALEERLRPRTDTTTLYGNEDQLPPMARAILAMESVAAATREDDAAPRSVTIAAAQAPLERQSEIVIAEAHIPDLKHGVPHQPASAALALDAEHAEATPSEPAAGPSVTAVEQPRTRIKRTKWQTVTIEPTARRQRAAAVARVIYEDVKPVRRQARGKQQGVVALASSTQTPRRRTRTVAAPPPSGMPAMGLGAGGMVWPGDAPPSRRRG